MINSLQNSIVTVQIGVRNLVLNLIISQSNVDVKLKISS